jgi:uncharacterized paraquat-inducible protein A
LGIGKSLSATAAPFWIGLAVTIIAALTTSIVLSELKKSSFLPELDDSAIRGRLIQRLTRDFDAVQSVASVVAVGASALAILHLSQTEIVITFVFGFAFLLAILQGYLRMKPSTYSHYAKKLFIFTPLVSLLLLLNVLGLILVVLLD